MITEEKSNTSTCVNTEVADTMISRFIDIWRQVASFLSPSEIQDFRKCAKLGQEVAKGLLSGRILVGAWKKAYIFDAETCEVIRVLDFGLQTERCFCAKFSRDGSRVVTASAAADDHMVKIWDSASGKLLLVLRGHTLQIRRCIFSYDGKRVITISMDRTARLWSAETGDQQVCLVHDTIIQAFAISNDGQSLVTSNSANLNIFCAVTGVRKVKIYTGWSRVLSVAFSRDDKLVHTGYSDGTIRNLNATTGERMRIVRLAHTGQITTCIFSPTDYNTIFTVSRIGNARICNARLGRREEIELWHGVEISDMVFCDPTSRIITASSGVVHADLTVRVWDCNSKIVLAKFIFADQIFSCDFTRTMPSSTSNEEKKK